jgi:DNA-binding transcriptional ArsR family regulator
VSPERDVPAAISGADADPGAGADLPTTPRPVATPGSAPTPTSDPALVTSTAEGRELTDARELRALTHPVRLALLEVLGIYNALTATEAGELIGESPTTCSFHLRQLARYGFVEEAGGGAGRRRPWRVAQRTIRFSATTNDPDLSVAASALENLLVKRWLARYEQWERTRFSESAEWQAVADVTQNVAFMTADEVIEMTRAMQELMEPFRVRQTDPSARPAGSRPVETLTFSFPVQLAEPVSSPGAGRSAEPASSGEPSPARPSRSPEPPEPPEAAEAPQAPELPEPA